MVLISTTYLLLNLRENRKSVKNISVQDAYALLAEVRDVVIIDIRKPQEYSSAHIKNALNIDYYDRGFYARINELDKNKTYLIYCRTGNRSQKALQKFGQFQFKRIYHLHQGIVAWEAANLPLERKE